MDKNVEVLVVDDDLAAAQTFSELIATKYSFRTEAYSNLEKVLEVVRTGTVKVVVFDERMPDMNGTDLFNRRKKSGSCESGHRTAEEGSGRQFHQTVQEYHRR